MVLGLGGNVHGFTQCLQNHNVLLRWADTLSCGLPVQEASSSFFMREEGLRQEVSRLEDRVRALEDEKTELVASSSDHTRPLMRWALPYDDRCTELCNCPTHHRKPSIRLI